MEPGKPIDETKLEAERRRRLTGIGLMCCAVFLFSCLDTTAKWLGQSLDPVVTTWARYAFSVLLVSLVINPWNTPGALRTRRPGLQAIRSVLLLVSTILNFFALQYLQLAETVSIQFAAPLLVALLSIPLLGERVGPRRLAAIGVGFLGVLIVVRPGFGALHPAVLLVLASVACYSLYGVTTRMLVGHDSSQTTMFYSGIAGVLLLTPVLPFFWTTPPSALHWAGMVAVGFFGGFGHWLLIRAHARAPAGILYPFIYTQLFSMVALGWLVFGDLPDRWTLIGSAVVMASGLYLIHRERVRGPRAG